MAMAVLCDKLIQDHFTMMWASKDVGFKVAYDLALVTDKSDLS